jgi:transposase
MELPPIDNWVGLDVGKSFHVAHVMDENGELLFEREVENAEPAIERLIDDMLERGTCAIVIDQPGSIAALVLALAARRGVPVAYVPGLVMRRASDLYEGNAKTDSRDAFVLADHARLHAKRLRWLKQGEQITQELELLCGHDEDLRGDTNRTINRIRDLLVSTAPGVERVLSNRFDHPAVAHLLTRYPSLTTMRAAGKARIQRVLSNKAPRMAARLAAELWTAIEAQTVTTSTDATVGQLIRRQAEDLQRIAKQRKELETQITELFHRHPDAPILSSIPGIGPRIGARILTEIGDISRFPTADHLASYAGLAPRTHQSGTSIRGETKNRFGNHRLKNALFLGAFCSLHDPNSRAYYARKRAQGKRHNAAIICLARRRLNMIYAMLRDRTLYAPPASATT